MGAGTLTDLPRDMASARSDTSCSKASRTGVWLTPRRSVSMRSVRISPGLSSPIISSCLSWR
ncbi:Uncharacterised protein [Bordetella pertussis]|nr:Uncharacterised protein [Bordetella pertussis]